MSPLLVRLFEALDEAQVEYCVLRGAAELASPQPMQEIDLLVQQRDLSRFRSATAALGFVPWPAWGHAPHEFFVGYDPEVGQWLKLDVVARLRYGKAVRCLEMDLVAELLGKRRRCDWTWVLAPEHEFLTLLLHCIFDKERFPDAHQERLAALWEELGSDPIQRMRMCESLATHLGDSMRQDIEWAMDRHAWGTLLLLRPRLVRGLLLQQPLPAGWRQVTTRAMRRLRPLLFLVHRPGTSTVLLAPDGGGKSTLAAALAQDPWLRAQVLYMGGNGAAGGIVLPTTPWLKRQLQRRRWRLSPTRLVLRWLYSLNHVVEDHYRQTAGELLRLRGRFVIYDRYFYDSYLSWRAHTWRVRFRRWLLERTSPSPDLVIVLDAPGEVLHERKGEHTPERLERQRQILLDLAETIHNVEVLDATQNTEEVRRRAIAAIWAEYGRRHIETP